MKVPFTQFTVETKGFLSTGVGQGNRLFTVNVPFGQSNAGTSNQREFIERAITELLARELYAEKTK